MNIEMRFFDNFEEQKIEKIQKNKQKFSPANESLFKEHMPSILESWGRYLEDYAKKTGTIFNNTQELPWLKFDEQTWVSSLGIAIARNYTDAILVAELPVRKRSSQTEPQAETQTEPRRGKSTDLGNADMWCCLNPTKEKGRFSFYLEAKCSSWARRQLVEHKENRKESKNQIEHPLKICNLNEVHNQIADENNKDNLLRRVFRDYQKSAGKQGAQSRNYTTTSPHQEEDEREHDHVFLTMIIKPVLWETTWEEKVEFKHLFEDKVSVDTKNKRNFYNFPSAGMIMRDQNGYGFIALILMLGETKK